MRAFEKRTLNGVEVSVEDFPDALKTDLWSILTEVEAVIPKWLHGLKIRCQPIDPEDGESADVTVLWEYGMATIRLFDEWIDEKSRSERRLSIVHELVHVETEQMWRSFGELVDAAFKDSNETTHKYFGAMGRQAMERCVTNLSTSIGKLYPDDEASK